MTSHYTKEQISSLLSKKIITVVFIKKDGSERTMKCTTNLSFVPNNKHPKSGYYIDDTDVLRVYDVEANDWRSFSVDSVKIIID